MEDVKSIFITFFQSFFNLWFIGLIALIYILLYSLQDALIYHPRNYHGRYQNYYHKAETVAKSSLKMPNGGMIKNIQYVTKDKIKHTAYWIPPFKRDYFKRCNDEYLQKIKEDQSENVLPHFELWITGNGNAGLAKDWLAFSAEYVKKQYDRKASSLKKKYVPISFLLIDYPGYGANVGGMPSPSSILESYQLAVNIVQIEMRKYFSATNIKKCNEKIYGNNNNDQNDKNRHRHHHHYYHGLNFKLNAIAHSIGSSAVLQYGATTLGDRKLHIHKYILISPFSSMFEMTKVVIGPLPFVKYMLQHDWDNLRYVKQISECHNCNEKERVRYNKNGVTINIFHGTKDEVVPFRMGQEVYEFVMEKLVNGKMMINSHGENDVEMMFHTKFTSINGANHNNIVSVGKNEIMNQMLEEY